MMTAEPPTQTSATFPARWLTAALSIARKSATRYNINGVLVRVKGGRLDVAATDGSRLIHISRNTEPNDTTLDLNVVIDRDTIKALNIKARSGAVTVRTDDVHSYVVSLDHTTLNGPDRTYQDFPSFEDVIPTEDGNASRDQAPVGMDLQLLAGLATALHKAEPVGDDKTKSGKIDVPTYRVTYRNDKAPLTMRAEANGAKLVGVIMPRRLND